MKLWNMNKVSLFAVTTALLAGVSSCASLKPATVPQPVLAESEISPEIAQRAELVYQVLAGEITGKLGDLKQATEHYLEAAKLSDDPEIAARTARIALFSKDYDLAFDAVNRWVELEPGNPEALRMAGLLYVHKGEPDKAAEYLAKVIDAAGEDAYEASFAHLNLMFGQGEINGNELKTMDLLRQRYPNVVYAHQTYAEMAYRAKNYEAAIVGADAVLAIDPANKQARIVKYRAMLSQGDADAALAGMKQLLASEPDDPELRHNYARMLVQARRYEEALREYDRILGTKPDDKDLIYSAALLDIELKHYPKARQRLNTLIESPNHRNEAFYYLGRIDEDEGKLAEAIEWYSRIHDGDYYFDASSRIATLMAANGQLEDARNYIRSLREQTSNQSVQIQLYLLEGELIRDRQGAQQAYDFYDEVLKTYPDNTELLYARAMVAESIGHIDWLERDLLTIIKREPENATALNALGYTLADRTERYQEAEQYIRKALKIRPADPAILDSMGWVKYKLGDLQGAEEYLRKAYAITPDAEIAAHLSEVRWLQGKKREAREILREALKTSPKDSRLLELQKQYN